VKESISVPLIGRVNFGTAMINPSQLRNKARIDRRSCFLNAGNITIGGGEGGELFPTEAGKGFNNGTSSQLSRN
jgi:hypothetical protein